MGDAQAWAPEHEPATAPGHLGLGHAGEVGQDLEVVDDLRVVPSGQRRRDVHGQDVGQVTRPPVSGDLLGVALLQHEQGAADEEHGHRGQQDRGGYARLQRLAMARRLARVRRATRSGCRIGCGHRLVIPGLMLTLRLSRHGRAGVASCALRA